MSAFPLACADFSFPLLGHEQVLSLIAMLGFAGVDVGVFAGRSHVKPDDVIGNPSAAARELSMKLADRGLAFADIFLTPGSDFYTLALNHPDEAERKKSRDIFERVLEFAARCQARHMTCLPGGVFDGENLDAALRRAADELTWRVARAKDAGITLAVEAHIGSVAPTPEDALKLLSATPGLTLTLDYGHFVAPGMDQKSVTPLVAHASHFHARCGCKDRLQCSFEHNTIDFDAIVREMKRTNYPGYLGVEYVWIDWQHCNDVDNLSETILLRDHLRELMR